jgi:hypothetical protein
MSWNFSHGTPSSLGFYGVCVISFFLSLVILLLTGGDIHLWDRQGLAILPYSKKIVALLFLLSGGVWFILRKQKVPYAFKPIHAVIPILVLTLSAWLDDDYSLFRVPSIRGELILASIAAWCLIPRLSLQKFRVATFLLFMLVIMSALKEFSRGILISDDHATFIMRINLLKSNFPLIPFFSPLWNAGFDVRDFFATGALSFFFLFSPLFYLFEVEKVYNTAVLILLLGVVPASSATATKLLSRSRYAPYVAALLSIAPSLVWYRWALKYGTMGFVTSYALFPPAFFLLAKIFWLKEECRSTYYFWCFVIVTLMLFWSPSGIALLPLLLLSVWRLPCILRDPRKLLLIMALIIVNGIWIAQFLKVSRVATFLETPVTSSITEPQLPASTGAYHAQGSTFRHKRSELTLNSLVHKLRELSRPLNPLVVFVGVVGLLTLRSPHKIPLLATLAWLIALAIAGPSVMPQLELDRMILLGSGLLILITAHVLSHMLLFYKKRQSKSLLCIISIALSYVLTGPFITSSIFSNRTIEQYSVLSGETVGLIDAIKKSSPEGRTFFSGFLLHEFDGGHLAPLAVWTQRPLLAYSYAHNMWRRENMIDKEFLAKGSHGIEEFLDLFTVQTVIAHEKPWIDHLKNHPDLYEYISGHGIFKLYARKNFKHSYFIEGSGTILEQTDHSVRFITDTPNSLIKFRYFPFLQAETCRLEPYFISPQHSFIRLSDCPIGKEITLQSISPLQRFLQ